MGAKSQNKRLIFILIGAVVFSALFVLVYAPMQASIKRAEGELATLQADVSLLKDLNENADDYELKTQSAKQYIDAQMSKYPADIKEEDTTMWVLSIESATNSEITSINFSPPTSVLQFKAFINASDGNYLSDMSAFAKTSSFTGTFSYEGAKNVIDIIYSSDNAASIDSVNLAYDASSSQLLATFNVSQYYISYPGAVYSPPSLANVGYGVQNPFLTY